MKIAKLIQYATLASLAFSALYYWKNLKGGNQTLSCKAIEQYFEDHKEEIYEKFKGYLSKEQFTESMKEQAALQGITVTP